MNHITPKQFLELPEEVQKVFINWWSPNVGDIVKCRYYDDTLMAIIEVENEKSRMSLDECRDWYSKEELIPLFRLDQLWEFIEDILEEYVEVQFIADEYAITATFSGELLAWEEDKLQSFWKASIRVAEASLKESEK